MEFGDEGAGVRGCQRVPVPVDGQNGTRSRTVNVFSCSADGNYEVTLMTKATVYFNGLVVWQPPAVYKSSCAIDVEFFPYDVQTCVLKLGSWTYDGFKVRVVLCWLMFVLETYAPCTYRLFTLGKGIKLYEALRLLTFSTIRIACAPKSVPTNRYILSNKHTNHTFNNHFIFYNSGRRKYNDFLLELKLNFIFLNIFLY